MPTFSYSLFIFSMNSAVSVAAMVACATALGAETRVRLVLVSSWDDDDEERQQREASCWRRARWSIVRERRGRVGREGVPRSALQRPGA